VTRAEVRAYFAALEQAVEQADDDDALNARVEGLDGGTDGLLHVLASGMALSFRPERAAGETGLVQFVVETRDGPVELWLDIRADDCRTLRRSTPPDTVITIALPVFLRIAFKRLTGADAYMDGQVRATGDVVLATSLDDWFDAPGAVIAEALR
jgi:hypothetical protein